MSLVPYASPEHLNSLLLKPTLFVEHGFLPLFACSCMLDNGVLSIS